jgi:hypothetical protein
MDWCDLMSLRALNPVQLEAQYASAQSDTDTEERGGLEC